MISSEYSFKNGKNQVTKKPRIIAIFLRKVLRSYRDLGSQADPAKEN